jgi:Arc/MetJ-type ribon-helix-helix transcriptional regulator
MKFKSYIKSKVSGGFYGNATEVIRDAIRRAVAEGEAQLDRGEGTEYSRDLMNKLADTARKNRAAVSPFDSDVTP